MKNFHITLSATTNTVIHLYHFLRIILFGPQFYEDMQERCHYDHFMKMETKRTTMSIKIFSEVLLLFDE